MKLFEPGRANWRYYQNGPIAKSLMLFPGTPIKRSHFAGGDLTPPLTKGDARPLWNPHNFVPASRGGVNIESNDDIDSLPYLSSDVQCAHLVALSGTVDRQCGQSLVSGAGAGAGFFIAFICRIITNNTNAMIKKLRMVLKKIP